MACSKAETITVYAPEYEAPVPVNLQPAADLWRQWGLGDANSFMSWYNQTCAQYPGDDWFWIGSTTDHRLYFCCSCEYMGAGDAGINALVAAGFGSSPSFEAYIKQLRG